MSRLHLKMPAKGTPVSGNKSDPLLYYYHPLVGWLYERRINLGLSLLEYPIKNILEVGVGSGLLVPLLGSISEKYVGIDLILSEKFLSAYNKGDKVIFHKMDICKTSFDNDSFDTIICFSVLEHILALDDAVREITRILKPRGQFIAGFPSVNSFMTFCFHLIGFHEIKKYHLNNSNQIIKVILKHLKIRKIKTIPPFISPNKALYTCLKTEK